MDDNKTIEISEDLTSSAAELNNQIAKFNKLNIKRSHYQVDSFVYKTYSICMKDYEFASGIAKREDDIQEKIYNDLIIVEKVLICTARTTRSSK